MQAPQRPVTCITKRLVVIAPGRVSCLPRTDAQGEAGEEMEGFFFGSISPALLIDAFLADEVDHDAAVKGIKERIPAVIEKAEEGEEPKTEKREKSGGKRREPVKKLKIEGEGVSISGRDTPPTTERAMYLEILQRPQTYGETLEFVDTSANEDRNCAIDGRCCKPDIVAYNPGCTRRGVTDSSRIEVTIEVKPNKSYDPFTGIAPLDEYPASSTSSLARRAGQPSIAWGSANQKRQFLKDTCRIDVIEMNFLRHPRKVDSDLWPLLRESVY